MPKGRHGGRLPAGAGGMLHSIESLPNPRKKSESFTYVAREIARKRNKRVPSAGGGGGGVKAMIQPIGACAAHGKRKPHTPRASNMRNPRRCMSIRARQRTRIRLTCRRHVGALSRRRQPQTGKNACSHMRTAQPNAGPREEGSNVGNAYRRAKRHGSCRSNAGGTTKWRVHMAHVVHGPKMCQPSNKWNPLQVVSIQVCRTCRSAKNKPVGLLSCPVFRRKVRVLPQTSASRLPGDVQSAQCQEGAYVRCQGCHSSVQTRHCSSSGRMVQIFCRVQLWLEATPGGATGKRCSLKFATVRCPVTRFFAGAGRIARSASTRGRRRGTPTLCQPAMLSASFRAERRKECLPNQVMRRHASLLRAREGRTNQHGCLQASYNRLVYTARCKRNGVTGNKPAPCRRGPG